MLLNLRDEARNSKNGLSKDILLAFDLTQNDRQREGDHWHIVAGFEINKEHFSTIVSCFLHLHWTDQRCYRSSLMAFTFQLCKINNSFIKAFFTLLCMALNRTPLFLVFLFFSWGFAAVSFSNLTVSPHPLWFLAGVSGGSASMAFSRGFFFFFYALLQLQGVVSSLRASKAHGCRPTERKKDVVVRRKGERDNTMRSFKT